MATKGKLGPAKRFGARYGRTIKHLWGKIVKKQNMRHTCPYCKSNAVKRVSAGIWQCKKCNAKFTGRAYEPGDIKTSFGE